MLFKGGATTASISFSIAAARLPLLTQSSPSSTSVPFAATVVAMPSNTVHKAKQTAVT